MIGYILISYGPKPSGGLESCSAARQQRINLFEAAERLTGERKFACYYDYARKVEGLDQLPKLRGTLDNAKKKGFRVFIDTYLRLFCNCPISNRKQLLKDLQRYSGHLFDVETASDIGDLNDTYKARLLLAVSPVRFKLGKQPRSQRSAHEKHRQTSKATKASQRARSAAADAKAAELLGLQKDLTEVDKTPKLAALVKAANDRGLKTTRGNDWTVSSAQRALRRVTQDS
ncbi:hypothetical protein [Sulfitobacter alexandrii]|uniref:hypothetical protein n=1 Tax=Sulfitobacter alexandrii TaxID=1917485 RepID=UPI0012EC8AB0|nr:hypothetical protein [Sulfitobacter alexandrii]